MKTRPWIVAVLAVAMLISLAGCGGSGVDVPILLMPHSGMAEDQANLLQQELQGKLGEAPTVEINATPIFSIEKLIAELAAADNGIIIVSKDMFDVFVKQQGSAVSLDELGVSDKYPDMVIKNPDTNETHLYGIPVSALPWFKHAHYTGEDLYAFIPINFKHPDKAMAVMKAALAIE